MRILEYKDNSLTLLLEIPSGLGGTKSTKNNKSINSKEKDKQTTKVCLGTTILEDP